MGSGFNNLEYPVSETVKVEREGVVSHLGILLQTMYLFLNVSFGESKGP